MTCLRLLLAALAASIVLLAAPPSPDTSEALKLVEKMSASYYHPDGLKGLVCDVKVDFNKVYQQINLSISPEAIRAASAVTIQVHADRGKSAWLVYGWSDRDNPRRESLETAVTKLVRSIFVIYWTFIARPLRPSPTDQIHLEPAPGGGHVLVDEGAGIRVKVSQDNVPFEFQFETRPTKVTMTPHYSPSPNPASGDLRRMTAVDESQITGTNITNARIDLDYQDVEGFHVPHHASFSVGGVFAVPVEFTGCSIATAGR